MSQKTTSIVTLLVIVIIIGGSILAYRKTHTSPTVPTSKTSSSSSSRPKNLTSTTTWASIDDFKNGSYQIEQDTITLVDGKAETPLEPDSASVLDTEYFGNEARGDLNGDGKDDIAFLVAQNGGGTGTFYYVVAFISGKTGYQGTNGLILGDRIAPQTTEIKNTQITVNYADRAADEPMDATPTVAVSKHFKVSGGKLVAL